MLLLAAGTAGATSRRLLAPALALQSLGSVLAGVAGMIVLVSGDPIGRAFTDELAPRVGVDPLSGFFVAVVALVAAPAAVYAIGYLRDARHPALLAVLTGLFPLTLVGVLVARDPVTLLASWELMSLVPAAAILVAADGPARRRVVFEYLAITHLGGVGVWVAVLMLAERGALSDPAVMTGAGGGAVAVIAVAGLVGFGTKAGLVPLHAWLPRAHPEAPGHVSAVMSGAMVAVAVYGLVRLALEWLGEPRAAVGIAMIALGALSSVAGILYAAVQGRLKRLLAFSTIENMGLVVVGVGGAALLASRGERGWAGVMLAGALLHVANHAVLKALLFLGASSVDRVTGGSPLAGGGLLGRMPWTGTGMLVGGLGLAGIPLLSGFAGEWVILQGLLELARSDDTDVALLGAVAVVAVGVTAGLAALCFASALGVTLLGRPRSPAAAEATDPPPPMTVSVAALAVTCAGLSIAPGLLFGPLVRMAGGSGTSSVSGIGVPGSMLPALAVGVALPVLAFLLVRMRGRPAQTAPAWTCGHVPDPALAWTPAAFVKPLVLILTGVLRPDRHVLVQRRDGIVREVRYVGSVPHLFDRLVYAPIARTATAAGMHARRLQSGSLRAYLTYLVALMMVLLALAHMGALG